MIIKHEESVKSEFEGTVIDVETIGSFCDQYPDSRRYKDHLLVIIGFIDRHHLRILCAKGEASVPELLEKISRLEGSPLEKAESLEQLRWLENGYRIRVDITTEVGMGIDTPEDLEKARAIIASGSGTLPG